MIISFWLEGRYLGDGLNFLGVFGHVNIDYLMNVTKLPEPNTCIQVDNVRKFNGGTGANIAILASSLGVRTALASFVGSDFPEDFKTSLQNSGVDIRDLKEIEDYKTPTCRIMTDPENNQMGIMDQGPMGVMDEFGIARYTVENSQIIHVGTGRPRYYKRIMKLASEMKKPVFFDPAQEIHYVYDADSFKELLNMSGALFVNRSELATALRYLGEADENTLLDHVDMCIVTLGKDGSRIFLKNERIEIPAIEPDRIVDPTGAGDAYRAGFYAGLSRGMDWKTCGLLGSSAASLILEVDGSVSKSLDWNSVLERTEKAY
jgi:sugar/nucleoside kinase (ribokinase family)